MSQSGSNKRDKIFSNFRDHLNFLNDKGFIQTEWNIYICPICLEEYKQIGVENPLTLEDAPPKSLGGNANILTCKRCNNTCGSQIDSHLSEHLKQLDSLKFLPNTQIKAIVKIGDNTFQGTLIVKSDGEITMQNSLKNNHPKKLKDAMEKVQKGQTLDMNFMRRNIIPENLASALLKTAYLKVFEKYGYTIILDKCYDDVRNQILNPTMEIYPKSFWFIPPYPKELNGVYFVCNPEFECIVTLYTLKTKHTEKMYGAFMPLPLNPINIVLNKLNETLEKHNGLIDLQLYPVNLDSMDYLFDEENIRAMVEWINKRNKV